MDKKGIQDVDVGGKRVLVRVDFNVPMDDEQKITDDTRIRSALPTITYLMEKQAKLILVSHLGRPKNQLNLKYSPDPVQQQLDPACRPRPPVEAKYSLAPVGRRLSELLGKPVVMAKDCFGPEVKSQVESLAEGDVLLLENIRYYEEEEENDPKFCRLLAELADIYVNDAFGTAHRAHASTEGIARLLPAYAGFLLQKEIEVMGRALENPLRPFTAIIGGAKVSDKIGVIEHLLQKVDILIIGGGMANTFLKAQGYATGKSLVENHKVDIAKELLAKAAAAGVELLLPSDVVVAKELSADAPSRIVKVSEIKVDDLALDIGPESAALFASKIASSQTVIWNGPMGVFEVDQFAKGTEKIAQALAECRGTTIVGGGDSVAAVEKMGVAQKLTHISTGGGASLEFLEGKTLPGVAALQDK